jgi:hypothetical protein
VNPSGQTLLVEPISTSLALLGADEGAHPRWIEITAAGQHYARQGERAVPLSDEDIDSMHRGFQLVKAEQWFSRGAPVTVNHATMSGAVDAESTKALAYLIDTRVDTTDGRRVLMGLADYTDEGRRRIRAGEFQGFSIEAIPPASARSKRADKPLGEWALIGGTFTNHPFVPGLAALAASETVSPNPEPRPMLTLLHRLGLAEDAAEVAVLAELDRQLSERDDKIAALDESLSTVTADRDAQAAKLVELAERDKDRTLDDACAAGRCSAAERDDFWKAYTLLGEEHAHRVYPEQRIPTSPASTAPKAPASAPVTGGVYAEVAKRAKALSETGTHPAAAFAEAYREIVTTPEAAEAFNRAEA